jgi:predicted dehydrogenase
VQVGTQNRSSSLYKKAKEWVKAGMIGDIHYVRAFWYRNSAENNPAWRYVIPDDTNPQNTDWEKFLGPAPKRAFDKRRYFQWRLYWDYSGGISTDLLVHQTDITNFMLDKTVPTSCMASGGIYRWTQADDDRDTPDTFSAIYEYPNKFHLNYSCYFGNVKYGYGEQLLGNTGTIEISNRMDLDFYDEQLDPKVPPKRPRIHINGPETFKERDGAINHFRNFINAVLGKEQVIAPPTAGQEAAISGHMATLSFKNQKKCIWDNATQKYRFV